MNIGFGKNTLSEMNCDEFEACMDDEVNFETYEDMNLLEVARDIMINNYHFDELMLSYFDLESFAKDLTIDGYFETQYGVVRYVG